MTHFDHLVAGARANPVVTLGFTGTRKGMTFDQRDALAMLLKTLRFRSVHHGDCVGADAEFHDVVRAYDPSVSIIVHPPTANRYRANKIGDVILPPLQYAARNRRIVEACDYLIACARRDVEDDSGTWQTIGMARMRSRHVTLIRRDGSVAPS